MRNIFGALAVSMLFVAPISTESVDMGSAPGHELKGMLDRWQTRLGLSEWRIEVRMVPPESLVAADDGTATVADIVYDVSQHSAGIRVQQAAHDEVEESLVHELMHLKLAGWQPPTASDDEEQTIDAIAYALLGAKSAK